MISKVKKTNRLIKETSPYLLQHAYNPVNWYPWGQEAFLEAKRRDVPIFLSIGYSSCHWCHVMENESFEDETVAGVLNENFVCIKVDREEMPDVDHIYMDACVALTGSGGWPLSCFLTWGKKPFYAGTYFPKEHFLKLLTVVMDQWTNKREDILNLSDQITGVLSEKSPKEGEINPKTADDVFLHLKQSFDWEYGGFSPAPKFPSVQNLLFLIRYSFDTKNEEAKDMVKTTLDCMARGGIFDHVGGGFCRYSTDRHWLVPHFEKMMVDNAMLIMAYIEAGCLFDEKYFKTAQKTLRYCIREMCGEKAFYTAQDADSEGSEGKYYLFTPRQIEEILGAEDGQKFCGIYHITKEGNFEKKSIPHLIGTGEFDHAFAEKCLDKVYKARLGRTPPFKDDKYLSGVNGLMLAALSKACRYVSDEYKEIADRLYDFIQNELFFDGRLYTGYREKLFSAKGTLDDYAYVLWGFFEAYMAYPDDKRLCDIVKTCDQIVDLFCLDDQFYLSGKDVEGLIIRPQSIFDGAYPAGNSIVIEIFFKVSQMTGELKYEQIARRAVNKMAQKVNRYPAAFSSLFCALLYQENGGTNIKITRGVGFEQMKRLSGVFNPFMTIKTEDGQEQKSQAYICRGKSCLAPTDDFDTAVKIVKG